MLRMLAETSTIRAKVVSQEVASISITGIAICEAQSVFLLLENVI